MVFLSSEYLNPIWSGSFGNLDSGFQSLVGFRIPSVGFRIPKPGIPDSTSKKFLDSGIRIPYMGRDACKHIPEVSIEWRFSFFITNFLSNHNYFIKILFSPGIIINPRPIETILQGCGSMPLLCVCNSFACLTSSDSRRYSSALEYSPTDVKTRLKLAQLAATPRLLSISLLISSDFL